MHMGMNSCTLCPRRCAVRGAVCGAPDDLEVAAICTHTGEEPPLNPIVNVFFAHCSLHCIFCQNNDISAAEVNPEFIHYRTTDQVADQICLQLEKQESSLLGFVTPTHYANRIPDILDAIHRRGATPTVVYNSSGYESVDTLRSLEGLVDIYLPDFKYMDSALASLCSHAPDYPEVAQAAIREMIRQVGTGLKLDENGAAYRGIIVRHLVLPGNIGNTLEVLETLADLSPFSPLHVSLMAQYFPPRPDLPAPFDRTLSEEEYRQAADRFSQLGFNGWLQELTSQSNYRPDFSLPNPFQTR